MSPRDSNDGTLGVDRRTVEVGGAGAAAWVVSVAPGSSVAGPARGSERRVVGAGNRCAVARVA